MKIKEKITDILADQRTQIKEFFTPEEKETQYPKAGSLSSQKIKPGILKEKDGTTGKIQWPAAKAAEAARQSIKEQKNADEVREESLPGWKLFQHPEQKRSTGKATEKTKGSIPGKKSGKKPREKKRPDDTAAKKKSGQMFREKKRRDDTAAKKKSVETKGLQQADARAFRELVFGPREEATGRKEPPRKKRKKLAWKWALLVFGLLILMGCFVAAAWLADYYPAAADAVKIAEGKISDNDIQVLKGKGYLVFEPEDPVAGLIFYPGAKVQYESYAPLMLKCARKNILCVLVHMPSNMAFLNPRAADGLQELYPQISDWYLGGHSLGGAMAAVYIADHTEDFRGLILLAAYSTVDLQQSGLKVLTMYGTEDRVMNRENYNKYRSNLPVSFTEYIMAGGCHANFGAYGLQKGDGTPTITPDDQLQQTANAIAKLVAA